MTDRTLDVVADSLSARRPTFLTVLCIITFVVSGYHLIMAIVSFFGNTTFDPVQLQDASTQMAEAMSGTDAASQEVAARIMDALSKWMQDRVESYVPLGITSLAASITSILGAYLMFNLRLTGYYVYIVAKVIGVLIPLIIYGVNILTIVMYGTVALIGVLFIVLYGTNRKYMS